MRTLSIFVALAILIGLLGYRSGSQPDRDAVEAARVESGVAFESRRVDVGDLTLHVVFAGPPDGKPVILLHGFPEFWYAWRGPAAVLARAGFRVIIPDQRGYNRSDKPTARDAYRIDAFVSDVVGLMNALGHERASLAAQDIGGAVGWRVVIDHPERIERFAVIDAAHPLASASASENVSDWHRTFLKIPWLPGYIGRLGNWWLLTSSQRGSAAPNTFSDEELDQFRSAWDRDGAIHSMAQWYRAESWPVAGDGRVSTATKVILAENDSYIPASATRASLAFLDDGDLLELGSGTHWVTAEEPERIGRILVEFFAGK